MFRFEFRNDCVTQPLSLLQKHARSSKTCKNAQAPKRMQRFGQKFCDAMVGRDEIAGAIRENEQQHAHLQYLKTEEDLARSLIDTVDQFVGAVNANFNVVNTSRTMIANTPRRSTWSSFSSGEDEEKEPLQSDEEGESSSSANVSAAEDEESSDSESDEDN